MRRIAVGLVIGAGLLIPSAAHAAVGVSVSGDTLEERTITFVATGSTDATNKVWAKWRKAGAPCAPTYSADPGVEGLFFGAAAGAQATAKAEDAGEWVVCAYLGPGSGEAKEAATVPVTIRANAATLSIAAPASVKQGERVRLTFSGTTELARTLTAIYKPASAGACLAGAVAEGDRESAGGSTISGSYSHTATLDEGFRTPGTYRICAFVHEPNHEVEAVATAVVTATVPLPVIGVVKTALGDFPASRQTRILYDLNTDATVTFRVNVGLPGVRVGSVCRKPARGRRGPSCRRAGRLMRTFTHKGRGNVINTLPFRARTAAGRPFPSGYYLLTARGRSAAGTGRPAYGVFIVRRK
jgi:hypothetical protein